LGRWGGAGSASCGRSLGDGPAGIAGHRDGAREPGDRSVARVPRRGVEQRGREPACQTSCCARASPDCHGTPSILKTRAQCIAGAGSTLASRCPVPHLRWHASGPDPGPRGKVPSSIAIGVLESRSGGGDASRPAYMAKIQPRSTGLDRTCQLNGALTPASCRVTGAGALPVAGSFGARAGAGSGALLFLSRRAAGSSVSPARMLLPEGQRGARAMYLSIRGWTTPRKGVYHRNCLC